MSELLGLVTDTITFSNVDGPGNRFVVFMQGCNFDCIACHNPYTIGRCDDCGLCVDACPSGALSIGTDLRVRWTESVCTRSDNCIAVCPATPRRRHVGDRWLMCSPEYVEPHRSCRASPCRAVRRLAKPSSSTPSSGP